jgi:ABC-type Fe3+/spermidine/putrescine transport system ATPase subunit
MTEARGDGALHVTDISKRYAKLTAVDRLSLTVNRGEFFTLLGPSGCGKTTTLRMIAGLERPNGGRISFDGEVWADAASGHFVGPQRRHLGMVFQSYALWPHMTVFENVAYPLKARRQPFDRVPEILEMVGLGSYARHSAARLSGGQQQRVALARALVSEPRLLLLDEPFSNLDVHLRHSLRAELRSIQRRLGLTVLLVTHDQLDAFVLSDRIGVMRNGRFEQIGDAPAIYSRPNSTYVRDFVGRTILFPARVSPAGADLINVTLPSNVVVTLPRDSAAGIPVANSPGIVSVRPEDVRVLNGSSSDGVVLFEGKLETMTYMGDHLECVVAGNDGFSVTLPVGNRSAFKSGDAVRIVAEAQTLRVWPDPSNP